VKTNTKKLTKKIADAAKYKGDGSKKYIIWDTSITGLGLRVYPSGKKSFVLKYRHHNRQRLMVLGSFGSITVDNARDEAKKELGELSKDNDPLKTKQQKLAGDSMKELCTAYMERHAKVRKKHWRNDQSMMDNRILPAIGTLKVKDVTREDISALHRAVGSEKNELTGNKKTYQANRVLALLSKMFELAALWGYVPETHPNPAKRIEKFSEKQRDRWVTPEELPKLAKAIDAEPNPVARDALWLYLLTGLRKSELLELKWSEVDLKREEIRFGDTKSGKKHYLPMSKATKAKLESITRVVGNPYVLPGKVSKSHLVNISKPWIRIRKAAGIQDVRLHDLRRTVGSWLAQSGNSLHLIGRVLNHSNVSTTQIYARFGQDSVKAALDKHGAELMGHAGKAKKAKVVKLA